MEIIQTAEAIRNYVQIVKNQGLKIGFVPTMGALHQGHLSLVERAKKTSDVVIASIFVNPTQFNNSEDLLKYPRTYGQDVLLLRGVSVDCLFYPSINEIYPTREQINYDIGELGNVLEGEMRPGHFNGVVQVVKRLFELTMPEKAFFGQKDFQQLAVVRHFFGKHMPQIEIVSVETIREKDGLAMSSRNMRLNCEQRRIAPLIFQSLLNIKREIEHGHAVQQSIEKAGKYLKKQKQFNLEYLVYCDRQSLKPMDAYIKDKGILLIAVWLDDIRLIDNLLA